MKLVALGTYDIGKPRMRILLRGLKENGVDITVCHENVWDGVEDKSQLAGFTVKFTVVVKVLLAYPRLIWRYCHLPAHDAVLIGYLGLFDMLVLWPFVKLRRVPIVWDVFLSLYNTIVEDRRLVGRRNPLAWVLYFMEWLALRLSDRAIIDTEAHAQYLRETYQRSRKQVQRVFVGVEPEFFNNSHMEQLPVSNSTAPFRVVFYGQFIPLHGIDTVVRAAKLSEGEDIEWLLIGKGQEAGRIRQLIEVLQPSNLSWIEWVKYQKLGDYLAGSDVVLGIFGDTDKAARVIPNKVYQTLSSDRPLITRDSPAIRELIDAQDPYHLLVPPADPLALLTAVLKLRETLTTLGYPIGKQTYQELITPSHCGKQLMAILDGLMKNT